MKDQFIFLAIRLLYKFQNAIPDQDTGDRQVLLTREDFFDLLDLIRQK